MLIIFNDSYSFILPDLGGKIGSSREPFSPNYLEFSASFAAMLAIFLLAIAGLPRMMKLNVDSPEDIVSRQCKISSMQTGYINEDLFPPVGEPESLMCACFQQSFQQMEKKMKKDVVDGYRDDHASFLRSQLRILLQGLGHAALFQRLCYDHTKSFQVTRR